MVRQRTTLPRFAFAFLVLGFDGGEPADPRTGFGEPGEEGVEFRFDPLECQVVIAHRYAAHGSDAVIWSTHSRARRCSSSAAWAAFSASDGSSSGSPCRMVVTPAAA